MAESQTFYPRPRTKRPGPSPASLGGAPGIAVALPPTSHVIPFAIAANANTRSCASSVKLTGPAIVVGLHLAKSGTAKGTQGIILGKHTATITEVNVAVATARAWTSLFDSRALAGSGIPNVGETDASIDFQPNLYQDDSNLSILILDAEFYLVIAVYAGVTGGDPLVGHVVVLERVNPAALANFL